MQRTVFPLWQCFASLVKHYMVCKLSEWHFLWINMSILMVNYLCLEKLGVDMWMFFGIYTVGIIFSPQLWGPKNASIYNNINLLLYHSHKLYYFKNLKLVVIRDNKGHYLNEPLLSTLGRRWTVTVPTVYLETQFSTGGNYEILYPHKIDDALQSCRPT